jgi:hypothetical protein
MPSSGVSEDRYSVLIYKKERKKEGKKEGKKERKKNSWSLSTSFFSRPLCQKPCAISSNII